MDKDAAYNLAVAAVTALIEALGPDAVFPFDQIWQYAPDNQNVPSRQRPALARRLQTGGYIVPTGGYTSAVTDSRAGSPTRAYRAGPTLVPPPATPEPQPTAGAPAAPAQTVAEALNNLVFAMDTRGFIVIPEHLANFYLALLSSPMVIMTGTSGTGKSWLPRVFAELTGSGFARVPVKPQWDDNSDMFGYAPPLQSDNFVQGEFTKAILAANANASVPYLVLLDEMNLAAVEHYFSDFLSVVETRRRQGTSVITDPLPLELPPPTGAGVDTFATLRTLALPSNVKVVGTANMDETTRSFSPKVLDRAFSIEFGDVDLSAFPVTSTTTVDEAQFSILAQRLADPANPVRVAEAHEAHAEICEEAAAYLESIRSILAPGGLSFAYRTRDAVCYYMANWEQDDLGSILPKNDALDYCVLQKVLPKIHGQGQLLSETLATLSDWLERKPVPDIESGPGFQRSAQKLARMRARLEADGTTTYWGT